MPTAIDPRTGARREISMEEFLNALSKADPSMVSVTKVVTDSNGVEHHYAADDLFCRGPEVSPLSEAAQKRAREAAILEKEREDNKRREAETAERKKKISANAADILAARKQADFIRSRLGTSLYFVAWVNPDGTVTVKSTQKYYRMDDEPDPTDVSKFTNIKSVVCTTDTIIGLREDGTCITTGIKKSSRYHLNEINNWRGVVQISAGSDHVVGLRADGTCVSHSIDHYDGGQHVEGWTDIREVVCGNNYTVGIKKDGSVVTTGSDTFVSEIRRWKDVELIAIGYSAAVGLTKSGQVLRAGSPDYDKNWGPYLGCVEGAVNIIQLTMSYKNGFALQADRKLIGKMNTEEKGWREKNCYEEFAEDILAVPNNNEFVTVGMDGTVSIFDSHPNRMKRVGKMFDSYEQYCADIEKHQAEVEQMKKRRSNGVCQYCGGSFKGFFIKKCSQCGKAKDY